MNSPYGPRLVLQRRPGRSSPSTFFAQSRRSPSASVTRKPSLPSPWSGRARYSAGASCCPGRRRRSLLRHFRFPSWSIRRTDSSPSPAAPRFSRGGDCRASCRSTGARWRCCSSKCRSCINRCRCCEHHHLVFFIPWDTQGTGVPRPTYDLGWTLNYEMFFYTVSRFASA
jgi:hypothetical protein